MRLSRSGLRCSDCGCTVAFDGAGQGGAFNRTEWVCDLGYWAGAGCGCPGFALER